MLFSPIVADKLREYVVEYQISLRLKRLQAQAKIFVVCLTYGWRRASIISEEEAISIAQAECACSGNLDLIGISLAYVPINNGEHVLCYEVLSTHGYYYIDVHAGNIIYI